MRSASDKSTSRKAPDLPPAVEGHVVVLEFQLDRIPRNGRMVAHVMVRQMGFRTT
jgi:hypothetical protein